ncbi:MAG: PadR family transcriptional regulator [Anaerolineaceae bacterium]|nr:PadR family transcriptional regulator [Anaerolineaceae bacterium]
MSLEHAILGFLNYRPYTGYDLKKIFDTSVRHFWPADQSQIYRTLNRITDRGWAEAHRIEQEKRPDRKEYQITELGKEEFQTWLKIPLPFEENRSAPLIQVFFAGKLSDDEILDMLEHVAETIRSGLEAYDAIPKKIDQFESHMQSPREFYFWMMTLEIGNVAARANLEWLENKIELIRNGEIPEY